MLTLLVLHGPNHEVHTGGICLAAQLEGTQLIVDPVCICLLYTSDAADEDRSV